MYRASAAGSYVPENVRRFLAEFRESVRAGNAGLVWDSVAKFEDITEETFQASEWPESTAVVYSLGLKVDKSRGPDFVFLTIYSELQHRHTFERCDVSNSSMCDNFLSAWRTYIALFGLLIDGGSGMPEMSSAWLWDVVNGFICHFQFWHHWKAIPKNAALLRKKGDSGETKTKQNIQSAWNIQTTLRYLQVGIARAGGLPLRFNPPIRGVERVSQFKRLLGLFGLTGLLRVHCLTCDYRSALECMDSVDLGKKSPLTHNQQCLVSCHYYLSFAFLMSKRWMDAHRTLSSILCRVQSRRRRGKTDEEEMTAFDIYSDKHLKQEALLEKCFHLLAIVEAICPQRLDKALIGDYLLQTHGSQIERMRNGTAQSREEACRSLFLAAAPDYSNVTDLWADSIEYTSRSSLSSGVSVSADGSSFLSFSERVANEQFDEFWRLVRGREVVAYKEELRLYRSIGLSKLAHQIASVHSDTFNLLRKIDPTVTSTATASTTLPESEEKSEVTAVTEVGDDGDGSGGGGQTLAEMIDDTSLVMTSEDGSGGIGGGTASGLTASPSSGSGGVSERAMAIKEIDLKPGEFERQLLRLKAAMRQYRRDEKFGFGASVYSEGVWVNDASFDFMVDDDIVRVETSQKEKLHKHTTSLLRQIRQISDCMEQFKYSA